ncbi:MAG: hypothetical protein J6S75_02610, partial [Thermoguttaceae bacterium]|nr:hypothetical protein [Thermoguttaceae bacterium]
FTGNSAKYGGAVSVLGNDAAVTITRGAENTAAVFSGNSAASFGGAIYASGTIEIDGATITDNTASLGGGVMAISSELAYGSGNAAVKRVGRGKVIFSGAATTFSGNTATRTAGGKNVGSDICASSSNSDAGNGAVIEIAAMPTFGGSTGYGIAIDRSILVLPDNLAFPQSVSVYSNKEFSCDYTYDGSTLAFTSFGSRSGVTSWKIYWSEGQPSVYPGTGSYPSGTVTDGTAIKIEGSIGAKTIVYYLLPTVNQLVGSGESMLEEASEALLDESLFDDTEVFEGLAPESFALDQYCDECFL